MRFPRLYSEFAHLKDNQKKRLDSILGVPVICAFHTGLLIESAVVDCVIAVPNLTDVFYCCFVM